ncbi:hypothetical protein ACXR0O_08745 [Verrucomicrobiota bacterium sgz303538]
MRRNTLILLILLTLSASSTRAGWFSRDTVKKTPDATEQVQRIQAEERLKAAQQQISTQEQRLDHQQQVISQLQRTTYLVAAGAVVLLIIGVALGSKARRDGTD